MSMLFCAPGGLRLQCLEGLLLEEGVAVCLEAGSGEVVPVTPACANGLKSSCPSV